MNRRRAAAAGLALALATASAGALPAQGGAAAPADVATRLHEAWLREMLDLDTAGAVGDYEAIAADRSGRIERWIAVARLAELQRLGLPVAHPGAGAEAPAAVRAALGLVTPLPVAELLRQAQTQPADPARLPELRPATLATVTWVRNQSGPSQSERQRQRAATGRQRPPQNRNDAERIGRAHASDVVLRELEGKTEQAASLRELYFPEWKPPTVAAPAADAVASAKAAIDAWLQEKYLGQQQQALLGRLRTEFDQRAAADAAAALAWLGRLPVFADRLLAAPSGRK
ncbi:MAG: hypothetical protein ACK5AL_11550 [Planctomycetota bacterium]